MPEPTMPAIGGARSFDQLEALAEHEAGRAVDRVRFHPDDAARLFPSAQTTETANQE